MTSSIRFMRCARRLLMLLFHRPRRRRCRRRLRAWRLLDAATVADGLVVDMAYFGDDTVGARTTATRARVAR